MDEAINNNWSLTVKVIPREHGLVPVSEHESAIKYERQQCARAESRNLELDQRIKSLEEWNSALRATQSSPEVLAVVEAAKAWYREVSGVQFTLPMYRNLSNAVAAMITVERKAEPKPEARKFWTTEVWPNGSIQQFGVQRGSEWHGPFPAGVCHALAIALNAADAAGRKS